MKWRTEKLKFLLSHIEGFVDGEMKIIAERAREYSPQTGLDKIQELVEPLSEACEPVNILDRLTPFFDSGLLLEDWKITAVFWRGSTFRLDGDEQIVAADLMAEVSPAEIRKAEASRILGAVDMEFLSPGGQASGFLIKPTPNVGFVLFSNLGAPWLEDHVREAHRLVTKAFVY